MVSIKPSQLTLRLDREKTVRLPVLPQFVGEPAAGATRGEATVIPPQVQVVGPESMIDRVSHLDTAPIRLDGHALDFEEVVNVVSPEPLVQVLQPSRVRVKVPLHLQPVHGHGLRTAPVTTALAPAGHRLFGTDGIRAPFGGYPLDRPTVTALAVELGTELAVAGAPERGAGAETAGGRGWSSAATPAPRRRSSAAGWPPGSPRPASTLSTPE